jgi:antitoxin (DNA-binding transcriptional repressor) of toxin-antitoxin stability system
VETIGLRELNQNPSRAVARVRAGVTLVVTDRGRPILRMVPEIESPGVLTRLVAEGTETAQVRQAGA